MCSNLGHSWQGHLFLQQIQITSNGRCAVDREFVDIIGTLGGFGDYLGDRGPGRIMWRSWEDLGEPWGGPWGITGGPLGAPWVPRCRPGAHRARPGDYGAQGTISSFPGGVDVCKRSIFTARSAFWEFMTLMTLMTFVTFVVPGVLLRPHFHTRRGSGGR